ncbi:MAG: ATP-binding protein [Rhodospirillaceae bacterium]|nr:ATP-binding protein [Rhodospirillales bacterium]
MPNIVGRFRECGAAMKEGLELSFSASSIPLKQRWRNNGLSADFLADYVTTFFPQNDPDSLARQQEIRGAVNYIANELLENAMKYSEEHLSQPITIKLVLESGSVLFVETNATNADRGRSFQAFVTELAGADPAELYVTQLERGVETGGSGLGLITMVNDYGAQLGWKFDDLGDGAVRVTTQVLLEI